MEYEVVINEKQLAQRIWELAKEIECYCTENDIKTLTIVPIMNGAIMFAADLLRSISPTLDIYLQPVTIKTYDDNNRQTFQPVINSDILFSLKDKDVIIVEDIVETGTTIAEVKNVLYFRSNARTMKVASLLCRERSKTYTDFNGFVLSEDWFVFGFGLDYSQKLRNLPYIARKI